MSLPSTGSGAAQSLEKVPTALRKDQMVPELWTRLLWPPVRIGSLLRIGLTSLPTAGRIGSLMLMESLTSLPSALCKAGIFGGNIPNL